MKIREAFRGGYLKADNLGKQGMVLTVRHVCMEDVGGEDKPVVYFMETTLGLVLNKTNAESIAAIHGDETDDWTGAKLHLFAAPVEYQGRQVKGIRVRQAEKSGSTGNDEEMPF